MQIEEILDVELLKKHIQDGVVSEMRHPKYKDLAIYNYTHAAQHDNIWDDVTTQTRGLIVDTAENQVLARPFRKFFNLNTSFRPETAEANLPAVTPVILEKMDGSLGILYRYKGQKFISTRGSFASDQAIWGTEWYNRRQQILGRIFDWPYDYTPLFEIIYKENRIVVSYDFEELVLLGLVNIKTSAELPPDEVAEIGRKNNIRSVQQFSDLDLESCISHKETNTEGFVIQYWTSQASVPLRIKVKTEEYVRLHKVVTGLNPKGIWEHLKAGGETEALWANTNPQFSAWVINWTKIFSGMYREIEHDAYLAFGEICAAFPLCPLSTTSGTPRSNPRKSYALAIRERPVPIQPVLFAMLTGKNYKELIWKHIEPKIEGKEVFFKNGDHLNGI